MASRYRIKSLYIARLVVLVKIIAQLYFGLASRHNSDHLSRRSWDKESVRHLRKISCSSYDISWVFSCSSEESSESQHATTNALRPYVRAMQLGLSGFRLKNVTAFDSIPWLTAPFRAVARTRILYSGRTSALSLGRDNLYEMSLSLEQVIVR